MMRWRSILGDNDINSWNIMELIVLYLLYIIYYYYYYYYYYVLLLLLCIIMYYYYYYYYIYIYPMNIDHVSHDNQCME